MALHHIFFWRQTPEVVPPPPAYQPVPYRPAVVRVLDLLRQSNKWEAEVENGFRLLAYNHRTILLGPCDIRLKLYEHYSDSAHLYVKDDEFPLTKSEEQALIKAIKSWVNWKRGEEYRIEEERRAENADRVEAYLAACECDD